MKIDDSEENPKIMTIVEYFHQFEISFPKANFQTCKP